MSSAPVILIATPTYGTPDTSTVSVAYHMAIVQLVRDPHFRVMPAVYGCDLVRGRSRLVRQFLETDGTHLLFWDEDVSVPAAQAGRLLARMVESGHPLVGCTYPKKKIKWDDVEDGIRDEVTVGVRTETAPADVADAAVAAMLNSRYEYAFSASSKAASVGGCVEVDAIPLGFTLATRAMLQMMVDGYRGVLEFDDVVDGVSSPTVAIFQLEIVKRGLLGEDYSFCCRWREMGGKVQLYVGPDCEIGHVGVHHYQSRRGGYARER